MSGFHMWLGIAVLATNGAAAGWGAVAWLRGEPSIVFWYLLRAAQASVAVQVVVGLLLLARGDSSPDGLHIAYGISPLVVAFVSEGLRLTVTQRELEGIEDVERLERSEQVLLARRITLNEMGVMTVGLLLVVTLALRAMQSGG